MSKLKKQIKNEVIPTKLWNLCMIHAHISIVAIALGFIVAIARMKFMEKFMTYVLVISTISFVVITVCAVIQQHIIKSVNTKMG